MSETVIKCESVYKIFGENAKKMLEESNGNVDAKTFQERGCIVGVNNASFEVAKGEMLVVMGLSGSGKSTLLRCISRLTDATGGKIFIEGQDLLELNNKELIELRRNKMGMVFQSFALLPHKTVVENIAFPLQIKGTNTVMGLSGSGKSTLLRCISRVTDATGGKIFIEGQDLLELNNKELIELRRNKMGMVFQSFALLPHKTVVENIAFPLQIKGTNTEESISRAMEMVKLVGLDGRENYFPRELSGGQQQRVGIARSLAVEPDIWFLDEPFSALDPLIRKEMQDEFLRLQEKLQKTIMFITHDFDEALKLADRIAIMKDGIIEQLDTPANIVLNPATEYVRKFTEEVPREKVLIIEDVMDASSKDNLGDLKVSKDEIIENVAEKILTQEKLVGVVDSNNNIVGSIKPSKIIDTVFGGRKNGS